MGREPMSRSFERLLDVRLKPLSTYFPPSHLFLENHHKLLEYEVCKRVNNFTG